MKTIASTLAAALIASASFAGAAFAAGDYYDGIWPGQNQKTESGDHARPVNSGVTGSIAGVNAAQQPSWNLAENTIDRGDYYEGVNRPN